MFSIEYLHTDSELRAAVEDFMIQWNNADLSIQVHTSGSTGTPKSIRIKKAHMQASARMTIDFLGLHAGQNALLCLSPDTIAGKMMIVRAMEANLRLIIGKVNARPLEAISEKIHFCAMVPLQVETSLRAHPERLGDIDCLLIGGAPLSPQLESELCNLPGKIYHTFGMTETISHIAMRPLAARDSTYTVLPGVQVLEKDGQLQIHAPQLGVNHLLTHDEVELTLTGFKWLGRRDFVVNSGGVKLHPEEIEAKLSAFIPCPFFVAGVPDERLGEALVLCVEGPSIDLAALKLGEVLPRYALPKKCLSFSQFLYTESGKIRRKETLNQLGDGAK